MKILFYTPFNLRSRDTESLMLAFKKSGHQVFFVSQQEGYPIRTFLETNGIETYSVKVKNRHKGILYHAKHLFRFIDFCSEKKIDIVYSHLESANFIASVGQYFVRAKVYLCRHHIDEAALFGFDRTLYYKITYSFAKKIVVVSQQAVDYMIEKELIPAHKIIHINLAYDFSLYVPPDKKTVSVIRDQYSCDILLVYIGRLNSFKRPIEAIQTLECLLKAGRHAKLLLLGSGDLHETLSEIVEQKNLSGRVFFLGYVSNPLDYLSAADFLVHPSILESSCVAVKEAGLTETPVIVCKGIGDFDSYIQNQLNGFLIDRDQFARQAAELIDQIFGNREFLKTIGTNLKDSVLKKFSIEHILPEYSKLNGK